MGSERSEEKLKTRKLKGFLESKNIRKKKVDYTSIRACQCPRFENDTLDLYIGVDLRVDLIFLSAQICAKIAPLAN